MIEITKGEWYDSSITSKIEGETLVAASGNGVLGAFFDEFQESNAELIIDTGNTYQKCGKLPSQLLSENEAYANKIEEFTKDVELLINKAYVKAEIRDWIYSGIEDLLTKLKQ